MKTKAALLTLLLSVPVYAGDMESPGVTSTVDPLVQIVIAVIQALSSALP